MLQVPQLCQYPRLLKQVPSAAARHQRPFPQQMGWIRSRMHEDIIKALCVDPQDRSSVSGVSRNSGSRPAVPDSRSRGRCSGGRRGDSWRRAARRRAGPSAAGAPHAGAEWKGGLRTLCQQESRPCFCSCVSGAECIGTGLQSARLQMNASADSAVSNMKGAHLCNEAVQIQCDAGPLTSSASTILWLPICSEVLQGG